MLAKTPQAPRTLSPLWMDLGLVVFLIAFDVLARLLPHAPGFMPVAASALFAARTLRYPGLSPIVPVAAMLISGAALAGDDWRITAIVVAAITLPALVGWASRRWTGVLPVVAAMLSCSLVFFVASNAAVWLFSGMYPLTLAGLTECFVLALPFLDKTVLGDLFWATVLFGGAWLVQHGPALARRAS